MCPAFDHRKDCVKTPKNLIFYGEEDAFLDFADAIPLKGFIVEMIYSLEEPSNASVMIEIFAGPYFTLLLLL